MRSILDDLEDRSRLQVLPAPNPHVTVDLTISDTVAAPDADHDVTLVVSGSEAEVALPVFGREARP